MRGQRIFFGRSGNERERQRAIFTSLYAADANCPKNNAKSHVWLTAAREGFDNRAPKDETRRAIEYVPKGTRFVGEVELPASQLDTLKRLVQEVDALGSGRSSSAGSVKLTLSDAEVKPAKAWNAGTPTNRLVLLLKNRDPLCITATATPDNLIPSLAFVPGRTLLGALAAWLISEDDRNAAGLLTSGKVSVGDALPLPYAPSKLDGVEVLPAPLSLGTEKPEGAAGDVPWWVHPTTPSKRLNAWEASEKLKRPEDDLLVFRESANDPWIAFQPRRHVRLRNGRPNPAQADAMLFAIEQIAEETYFLAELHGLPGDLQTLTEKLAPVFKGRRWLRVGRAGAPVEGVEFAWVGTAPPASVPEKALLILTSDLLVRDQFLRWRTELDQETLREMVGDAELVVEKMELGIPRATQESVMVHGFNGTSRLWRMPAAAIRRGSVFEISGRGVAKLAERAAKHEWLGERTHEGFGRFRIDAALPGVTSGPSSIVTETNTSGCDETAVDEEAIAKETQKWFRDHKALAEPGGGNDRKPSLSQWFDLVRDLEGDGTDAITRRLKSTKACDKGWKHEKAEAILKLLGKASDEQRVLHARYFVRWLRAEIRNKREAQ